MNVRIIRPEPTSSTNASATSATTAPSRSQRPAPPPTRRPLERSTSITSGRDAFHAGSTPKISAAANDASAVKASTVPSSDTAVARGRPSGDSWISASMPNCASSSPKPPPIAASTRLSATSWRTMRQRLPPMAARTASSRSRAEARTSSRLATFAHAISSTNTTAPISATSCGRTSATRSSCIGSMRRFMFDGLLDREAAAQIRRQPIELRLRLLERHAGLQLADDPQRTRCCASRSRS